MLLEFSSKCIRFFFGGVWEGEVYLQGVASKLNLSCYKMHIVAKRCVCTFSCV